MKLLFSALLIASLVVTLACLPAEAFPPAPSGLIYGLVKDQYGMPLSDPNDLVILQTPAGIQVSSSIQPNLAIGINYAIQVPMDAGLIPPPYVSNALTTGTQYKLYVVISGVTNVPIEMEGAYLTLGDASQQSLQNLTVGGDINNDGIPDAWEAAFLTSVGANVALTNINPNAIYTSDGRTLRQEYLLGNFPYNAKAFSVTIASLNAGSATLAFTTSAGRTYTVFGSTDLKSWTPLSFTVGSTVGGAVTSYYSPSTQVIQIHTVQPTNSPANQFFRLLLQ